MSAPFSLTAWWLLVSAYLSAAGWVLSAAGQLDALGYGIALTIGIAVALLWARPWQGWIQGPLRLGKLRWRFSHPLALLFLLYAVLVVLGGALYPPANYDALSYRLPRVLHWLAEERWHWFATPNYRMDVSASGFEWLMAPIIALARSDRPLFLINVVAYLLMPGLIYGAFTQLGIRRRVAWYWMWLLPAGYGYVTQAGSIGNDMISAVYLLAAVYYTLRARQSGRAMDLALGAVAAALMTGVKASNLPLLLPWAVAALGSLHLVRARPAMFAAITLLCAGISFLAIAGANAYYTSDWAGDPTNKDKLKIYSPLYGILGNGLMLLSANTAPPVMPVAATLDEELNRRLQSPFFRDLQQHFPRFGIGWLELVQEEGAGIGVGLSFLLVITAIAALVTRRGRSGNAGAAHIALPVGHETSLISRLTALQGVAVCLAAWVALLAYMALMGSEAAARLVAPYYPLLFASALLLPGTVAVVRRPWWQAVAFLAALSVLPAIILSSARPLWPAETVCRILKRSLPDNRLVERAATVYAVYRSRSDALGPLRKYLPVRVATVGFLGNSDDPETALWRPFGARRIVDITKENERQMLESGVSTLVVSEDGVTQTYGYSLDQWLRQRNVRILGREKLLVKAGRGPEDWVVVSAPADTPFGRAGGHR